MATLCSSDDGIADSIRRSAMCADAAFASGCLEVELDIRNGELENESAEERGVNGFDASATWSVSRYVGIKGAVSAHFKKDTFVDVFEIGPGETFTASVSSKERLYSLLAGIQLRDSESTARFTPFGHALIGAARQTARLRLDGAFDAESRETALAVRIGGGLDLRLNDRIDLRVIEVNYAPIFAEERPLTGDGIDVPITINGRTANNWTVGFGLVVH